MIENLGGLARRFFKSNKWITFSCIIAVTLSTALIICIMNFSINSKEKLITETLSKFGDFDILCGGFPCQSFSIAGKRLGFEDTRGTMFFEVARILRERQPKAFILENVKGLTNHDKGKTLDVILNTLKDLGYDYVYKVLNSSNYGIPQSRERWYCVVVKIKHQNIH